jgi:hypothetical protein
MIVKYVFLQIKLFAYSQVWKEPSNQNAKEQHNMEK